MTPAEREEIRVVLGERAARVRARRAAASGFGAAPADLNSMPLPPALDRFLKTGAPMSSFRRDLGAATAQVPWWAYGVGGLVAFYMGYKAYKRHAEAK